MLHYWKISLIKILPVIIQWDKCETKQKESSTSRRTRKLNIKEGMGEKCQADGDYLYWVLMNTEEGERTRED